MKKNLLLAIAAAGTMLSGQAVASSSSSGSFSLSYTLYDLNLTDGIAPTLTWGGTTYWNGPSGPAVWGAWTSTPAATATLTGSGVPVGTISNVSGSVPGVQTGSTTAAQYQSGTELGAFFTLSANTAVSFSLTGQAQAAVTGGTNPSYDFSQDTNYQNHSEKAGVWAYIYAGGLGALGSGTQNSHQEINIEALKSRNLNVMPYEVLTIAPTSFQINASFVNFTNASLEGAFNGVLQTYGYSTVAAVPEPESYAMLLAGLGVMGAVARRRKLAA